jgi:hypothetical protein
MYSQVSAAQKCYAAYAFATLGKVSVRCPSADASGARYWSVRVVIGGGLTWLQISLALKIVVSMRHSSRRVNTCRLLHTPYRRVIQQAMAPEYRHSAASARVEQRFTG